MANATLVSDETLRSSCRFHEKFMQMHAEQNQARIPKEKVIAYSDIGERPSSLARLNLFFSQKLSKIQNLNEENFLIMIRGFCRFRLRDFQKGPNRDLPKRFFQKSSWGSTPLRLTFFGFWFKISEFQNRPKVSKRIQNQRNSKLAFIVSPKLIRITIALRHNSSASSPISTVSIDHLGRPSWSLTPPPHSIIQPIAIHRLIIGNTSSSHAQFALL